MKNMVSVVIPVCNEESIFQESLEEIETFLTTSNVITEYEILFVENGSNDNTLFLAQKAALKNSKIRCVTLPYKAYGHALKEGILQSNYNTIIIINIDFFDKDFIHNAITNYPSTDIIIGSKLHHESRDERPLIRRILTKSFNIILRYSLKIIATDTHGLKVIKKECAHLIVKDCILKYELFDTEFILQAERKGFSICEIPVSVFEKRSSRTGISQRLYRAFQELIVLMKNI